MSPVNGKPFGSLAASAASASVGAGSWPQVTPSVLPGNATPVSAAWGAGRRLPELLRILLVSNELAGRGSHQKKNFLLDRNDSSMPTAIR